MVRGRYRDGTESCLGVARNAEVYGPAEYSDGICESIALE